MSHGRPGHSPQSRVHALGVTSAGKNAEFSIRVGESRERSCKGHLLSKTSKLLHSVTVMKLSDATQAHHKCLIFLNFYKANKKKRYLLP